MGLLPVGQDLSLLQSPLMHPATLTSTMTHHTLSLFERTYFCLTLIPKSKWGTQGNPLSPVLILTHTPIPIILSHLDLDSMGVPDHPCITPLVAPLTTFPVEPSLPRLALWVITMTLTAPRPLILDGVTTKTAVPRLLLLRTLTTTAIMTVKPGVLHPRLIRTDAPCLHTPTTPSLTSMTMIMIFLPLSTGFRRTLSILARLVQCPPPPLFPKGPWVPGGQCLRGCRPTTLTIPSTCP